MQNKAQGHVLALGTFDGVHLGHRALLQQTVMLAETLDATPIIYTFKNHPLSLFGRSPKLLMTEAERTAALEATGMPVVADPFDAQFAAQPPQAFVRMLVERFALRGAVVGFNYTFGDRGAGNTALLQALGKELGFAVQVIEPVSYDGAPVSSTRIRACLEEGELDAANAMLGACYALSGTVAANRRIGHTLGFPTANLEGYGNKVLPSPGVYAAHAYVAGQVFQAVTNVGNNPTVEGKVTTVETHLLEFDRDIYGMPMRVEFVARLRGEIRFPSREALSKQIASDAARAREILAEAGQ